MKIKDLCPDERPREKMRLRGAKALSNADLLAILLGSGTGGRSVIDVAQELMVSAGGRLSLLGAMPLEKLVSHKGVGEARAVTIAAALELGRRSFEELAVVDKRSITSPDIVYQLMLPQLKNLDHEECWVLYLNRANFLIGKEMITSGSLESTLIDTGRILRKAIEKQCSYVILVHNHPSGSPRPGQADIHQTDVLRKALAAVGIHLADHVVVAEDSFYSFSEERLGKAR
ncbi:MAG: DNA repair protein RadC [Bacteroidales bacterium]|nr:DNA repair protein RadC [Bacteroidales bacterium]